MDPDAALAEIRQEIAAGEPNAAMNRFEVLDDWLSRGGFLPMAWRFSGTRLSDIASGRS